MNKKIFIAIDTNKFNRAAKIVENTNTSKLKIGYKVGLELINSKHGRYFISKIKNKVIFLDLKLNDIPNTCSSTVKALKDLKINYLTVHISAGLEALRAVKKVSGKIKIVGVTTLTSLDNKNLKEIGYNKSVKNLIIHQSKLAQKAKLDALVCDGNSVKHVKKVFKKEIITPGIRFNSSSNDQKRVMTPKEAFKNGSDWLVIGRPIVNKGNIKKNIQKLINHLNK
jgi:orotidine-5'-phosphate decarboxylase